MKIQSKFQDYYDSRQYNLGEDVFYNRNMNLRVLENGIVKEPKCISYCDTIFIKYLSSSHRDIKSKTHGILSELYFNIVFIGDKIIPYCTLYFGNYKGYISGDQIEYKNIFSSDDIIDVQQIPSFFIRRCKDHLNDNYSSLFMQIRKISKEPIISFSSYNNYSGVSDLVKMNRGTTLNPSLKELGLSKIVEPNIVIQELEMFIKKHSNIEKEVEFSNELKILNAGFDKNSFRY